MTDEPTTMAQHRSNGDEDRALMRELQSASDLDGPFRELFQRYRRRLLAFFSRRGFEAETCLELSQETFFRVYRGMGSFRGDVPLASWIFQIAANLSKNELRRRQADKRSGQETSLDDEAGSGLLEAHTGGESSVASVVGQPLARALASEQVDALRRALDELPPQMRRAMQMSTYHGYSVAQIAAVMKLSESTVKVHLHQARKRLRAALAERFGELPF